MASIVVNGDTSGAVTLSAPAVAGTVTVSLPSVSGTMAVDGSSPTFAGITDSGNLTFTGTGNRITGDFSNATQSNRVMFQTSTTNGDTSIEFIPNGTGNAANIFMHSSSDPTNSSNIRLEINGGTATAGIISAIRGTGTYLPMTFHTGGSERMRIDTSGNLLVGTTILQSGERLAVRRDAVDIAFSVSNEAGSGAQTIRSKMATGANNASSYHFVGTTGALGVDKVYIYGNGNIVNVNNSYGTLSDVKLKENIVDATPKLSDVMLLKVRNFNLKSDSNQKQIGFVAQELEQVFPAMIDESPDIDAEGNALETVTKSVKTSVLIPILVKAIQEQQALITQLQADVAALKGA